MLQQFPNSSQPHPQQAWRSRDRLVNINLKSIRQSGYKIVRSNSNRTEHSLQTKKPLKLNREQPKLIRKHPLNKNDRCSTQHQEQTQSGSKAQQHFQTPYKTNTYLTHINDCKTQPNNINTQTRTFTYQNQPTSQSNQSSTFASEVECLRIIWENIKILKAKGLFELEIAEFERLIECMVIKAAAGENCLTDRPQIVEQKGLKTMGEVENIKSQIVEKLFNNQEMAAQIQHKKILYMIDGKGRRQVESQSFDSLQIENQESHKYEFLNLYQQSNEAETKLKDITNFYASKQQVNRSSNRKGEESVRANQSSNSSQQDRVFLKNIIKKSKKMDTQNPNVRLKEACCPKPTNKSTTSSESCYLKCNVWSKDELSSVGSSESKREVLNQIIAMLNQKYNKNIGLDSNRVYI